MFSEGDLLPISALQHLLYCDRQCALIHVERLWAENRFTAEGGVLHRRAHSGKSDTRPGGRTTRGLPVRSLALGLFGVADVVSFVSQAITLEPGDLIITGTPAGVGAFRDPPVWLQPGDEIAIEIDGVGRIANPVVTA